MAAYGLLDRAGGAVLFRSQGVVRTAADFLAEVAALAPALPDATFILNGCENRYWFAVVLASGLLRGQPNLLASDHSPRNLALLARLYPGAVSVTDRDGTAGPMPRLRVGVPGGAVPRADPTFNPGIRGDRTAAVVFTSGTTGEPTAHVKPWGGLVERTRAAAARFGFTEDAPAAVIGTVPPQHMYGFETTLLWPLHAAVASWAEPVFYPADVRAALAPAAAPGTMRRVLVTTPLQLSALVESEQPCPPALVISATAPLATSLAETAERVWGTEVHEIFGATEVGSVASRRTARDSHWTTYDGISLRGAAPPLVHAPFLEPRRMQDEIEPLDETRFRLIGRDGDMIKLGGRRASHAGLNHILTRIDGVLDGVFLVPGEPDRRPPARLIAVVVSPRRSAEDILTELRARVDPVFLPRRIVHVASLRRNQVGKLTSESLRTLREEAGLD